MDISARERKRQIRLETGKRIALLDEGYTREADRQILSLVQSLPDYKRARNIFCFVGSGREINTSPFLQQALEDGKVVAVPLCVGKRQMEPRIINALSDLKEGYFGILEPGEESALLPPQEIDLAVIPCMTCSYEGVRLGFGGGYYDTFFQAYPRIKSVMICRDRLVREDIPREEHDIVFERLITEKGIFKKEMPVVES